LIPICLTFDYELFFKVSGTISNSLIRPTESILNQMIRNGQKGTFFVDSLFLERLREIRAEEKQYHIVIEQLQRIISAGSRIELHLHPHWLDAEYDSGNWHFPHLDHYRMHSLTEDVINDIFVRGTQLLEEIAQKVEASYKVLSFRAGGWCLQPFNKLKSGMKKAGIVIDSSVARGMVESGIRRYDYTNAPDHSNWRFEDDPLRVDSDGSFCEIPISTYRRYVHDRVRKYLSHKVSGDVSVGDGRGLLAENTSSPLYLFTTRLQSSLAMLSIDSTPWLELQRGIDSQKKGLAVIISHPKSMMMNLGLKNLDRLAVHNSLLLVDVKS
jgi:hypothetical protein